MTVIHIYPSIPVRTPDLFSIALRAAWERRCVEGLDMDALRRQRRVEKAYREFSAGFAAGWTGGAL